MLHLCVSFVSKSKHKRNKQLVSAFLDECTLSQEAWMCLEHRLLDLEVQWSMFDVPGVELWTAMFFVHVVVH